MSKPPFLIIEDFLSPKFCDQIIDQLAFWGPDEDAEGHPLPVFKHHEPSEIIIYERLQQYIPTIEQYFHGFQYAGTERILFEFYGEQCNHPVHCENSEYIDKKWVRTKNRDITSVLFFQTWYENQHESFEIGEDVIGGKLEFPTWNFGFHPHKGMLILFPSSPHFINATAEIQVGELTQARIQMGGKLPYLYNPDDFPGDFNTWFNSNTNGES